MRVIPTFDPLEHRHLCFGLSLESTTVEQFALERGEKALRHRVVLRVTDRSHRRHHVGFPAALAERVARVLIAHRGLVNNVRGYMLQGDYRRPNPPAAIVEAVAHGEIDVALVWGPLSGQFAHQSAIKLRIEPIVPAEDPRWPMQFDIAMGVRTADSVLLSRINSILERERPAIRRLLGSHHVPEIS